MFRPRKALLRLPVQIAVWTLLLIALLGPHTPWSVCLTGKCNHPIAVDVTAAGEVCSCCHHEKKPGKCGTGENGAGCPGCCIDLAMAIDEAPLPTPVTVPDLDPGIVAILPAAVPAPSCAKAARYAGLDTGPPRTDQRTDLIATTILRE